MDQKTQRAGTLGVLPTVEFNPSNAMERHFHFNDAISRLSIDKPASPANYGVITALCERKFSRSNTLKASVITNKASMKYTVSVNAAADRHFHSCRCRFYLLLQFPGHCTLLQVWLSILLEFRCYYDDIST